MLKTRIITACCLAAGLAVVLLLFSFHAFVALFSLIFLVAAGEWANMVGLAQRGQQVAYAGVMACAMLALFFLDAYQAGSVLTVSLALSVLGWVLTFVAVRRYPNVKLFEHPNVLLFLGFWLLLPAWLGMLFLQPLVAHSGLVWLVIAIIAAADIGAYFAGRRFGKHKLAERVSPNKTWEGFWGGVLANIVLAVLVAVFCNVSVLKSFVLIVSVMLISCASVLGDLFESMVKRARGIKDSSQLLPGHGGVLDRIDGWTAAVPVFALLYLWGAVL